MEKDKILYELMHYKKFSTKKALADYLGITTQNIAQWFSRKVFDVNKVAEKFPEVNEAWLMTGEGEMLKPEYSAVDDDGIPNVNARKFAPLIPFEISNDLQMSIRDFCESCSNKLSSYEPSQLYPNFDYMYRMKENNMYPAINRGDLLYIKQIPLDNIINGRCYLLDTKKLGINVFKVTVKDDALHCESISDDYKDISIPISDIYDVYKIVGVFSYAVNIDESVFKLKKVFKDKDDIITSLSNEVTNQGRRIDTLLNLLNNNAK